MEGAELVCDWDDRHLKVISGVPMDGCFQINPTIVAKWMFVFTWRVDVLELQIGIVNVNAFGSGHETGSSQGGKLAEEVGLSGRSLLNHFVKLSEPIASSDATSEVNLTMID